MITIHTYSPATGETTVHGPIVDHPVAIEKFLSNKIRQFLRVRTKRKTQSDVLFSFGVLPPVKERNGTFRPAGVVTMKDEMPDILRLPRFVGTLQSLAEPTTFRRYIRHENRSH